MPILAVESPAPELGVNVVPEPLEMIDAEECGIERFKNEELMNLRWYGRPCESTFRWRDPKRMQLRGLCWRTQ